MDEKAKRADFDEILAVMKLTRADVEANRAGKFTAASLKRLEQSMDNEGCTLAVISVSLLFLTGAVLVALIVSPAKASPVSLGMLVLFIGAFALWKFYRLRLLWKDNADRTIETANGRLHTSRMYNRGSPVFYISVAGIRNEIPPDFYELLKTRAGEPFKVYYAPHSRLLLSLEPAENVTELDN